MKVFCPAVPGGPRRPEVGVHLVQSKPLLAQAKTGAYNNPVKQGDGMNAFHAVVSASVLLLSLILPLSGQTNAVDRDVIRKQAQKLQKEGNFKEALEAWQALALDPQEQVREVAPDLEAAVECLRQLNRIGERDLFLELAVQIHAANWEALVVTAQTYFHGDHHGAIVAGKFERGPHRGQGRYVNAAERDRVRAIQLMRGAMELLERQPSPASGPEMASFYEAFARILLGYREDQEAWRLQVATDIAVLPDYGEGWSYYGGGTRGAPVDVQGNPVFYAVPPSFESASSDGERWRWLLKRAVDHDVSRAASAKWAFASFLSHQFGVETLAGWYAVDPDSNEGGAETSTAALHTLSETETLARLATGIKRFDLPPEHNFIRLYRELAEQPDSGYTENAMNKLAELFTNRRQYAKAQAFWRRSIKAFGPGSKDWKQRALEQITGNWGRFEPTMTRPAGAPATLEWRFRNASKVTFDAREINERLLLQDVKAYLKANPRELDWHRVSLDNIGTMLVEKNRTKYLGRAAARWTLDLEPRPDHFDQLITVQTPLSQAGAYLVTATLPGGNESKIILWINDTVVVRKGLDNASWLYVADAVTGSPLPQVKLDFFGYRQEWVDARKITGRRMNIHTREVSRVTDRQGQAIWNPKDDDNQYQWLVTATSDDGRLAFLGFSHVWTGRYRDAEYNQRKVFGITDRPVYRPDQAVKFKFWIRHARYDQEDASDFADQEFKVVIRNPQGDKVLEKSLRTDAYAGLDGEYVLPKDAALGQYMTSLAKGNEEWGGTSFRVEEYKKPEFEVAVEAPKEPVMLGESFSATVTAKYYFGAPVQKGKVKIKVTRANYTARWYPPMRWDWFYGPGYWWFASDYAWYPGWKEWGCLCPRWRWWPARQGPPEVVVDADFPLGEDGIVKIPLDTKLAAELHGDTDHQYQITAEVTDESRRTVVGQGSVLVARQPFKVYAWVDRGHYRPGDIVNASLVARRLDGKPVKGRGELTLCRIRYEDGKPVEQQVQRWSLDTNEEGQARQAIKVSAAGQYRLSYTVTDNTRHAIEGGYVFVVRGEGDDGKAYRFSELELTPDQAEYQPGDTVKLMINTDHPGATILLFVRPANGVYLPPKLLKLTGKTVIEEIPVTKKDMPSFFVEAVTLFDGKLYSQTREIVVPPEKRVLNVEVLPSAGTYKPGEQAQVKIRLTDFFGQPFTGSTVVSVYDKAVEYIAGGSNVPGIKEFFWKWRRHHYPSAENNVERWFYNLTPPKAIAMGNLGLFGEGMVDQDRDRPGNPLVLKGLYGVRSASRPKGYAAADAMLDKSDVVMSAMPAAPAEAEMGAADSSLAENTAGGGEAGLAVEPAIRKEFADTAYWNAGLTTDSNGLAEVSFKMPENLTGWTIRTWALGHGTKVGEGVAEVVTAKSVLLRLQAPRFFVEKDEVVLSANIHNYLKSAKPVRAVLEVEGGCLDILDKRGRKTEDGTQKLKIGAGGEERVDWRVKGVKEGQAVIRMKALTDEESDAMEMKFPVFVHGMLKTESWSGVIRPDKDRAGFAIQVPAERRPEQSRLEIRYSPTLAGAMVDALPYLADYPYGCTEQTLNRFLPTVIVQKILKDMGLDLKAIRDKRTNLNAQEIGEDRERAVQWKPNNPPNPGEERNPVFDEAVVSDMVNTGLRALVAMQREDGGWGWFSGWSEQSWPHTTATVVHGLQLARANGVGVNPDVLDRGVQWLGRYQEEELRKLRNAPKQKDPWKDHADNLDALVYMVLVDAGRDHTPMRDTLYKGRTNLSVYAQAMLGVALHKQGQVEKRDMVIRNIEQRLVRDPENQTAYLNLGNETFWWCWYGSENEAHAYYLKLLAATDPRGDKASELVKYLLNNRKHATYWNSTRDTALCIEAMADYLKASGEAQPDMTVGVKVDGNTVKESRITADTLFSFDNKLVLEGAALTAGKHEVEVARQGKGPVYFNAYLANFTLEDPITRAGLEIKINRAFYKLVPADKIVKVAGSRGQALDQKVQKYQRQPIADGDELKSGDLVEVELEIASKNDYEYIIFEDMKAAGFEPVEVRSGYNGNDLGAYVEFRDERVCFFVRQLARGQNSVSYRLRAEIPGKFSALPAKASAMYAPELKANSDEIKLSIED